MLNINGKNYYLIWKIVAKQKKIERYLIDKSL